MAPVLLDAGKGLLESLNENSGAISAFTAVVSVIIAALYTFYTTRLWRVSIQQARNAEIQAVAAQRQLQLLERQMAETERVFEATHRPHLKVHAETDRLDLEAGTKVSVLRIRARNYGASAATVMSSECEPRPREWGAVWDQRFLPAVIPPGETEWMGSVILPLAPDVDLAREGIESLVKIMRWCHVYLRYRGLNDKEYETSDQISLMPDVKNRSGWMIESVTPTGPEFFEVHRST